MRKTRQELERMPKDSLICHCELLQEVLDAVMIQDNQAKNILCNTISELKGQIQALKEGK